MFTKAFDDPGLVKNTNLDSVTELWIGSSPLNIKMIDKIKKYFKNARLTNSYGMTEFGTKIFTKNLKLPSDDFSVGYPIDHPDVSVRIIDRILQVRAPSLCLGYTNAEMPLTGDGYFITNDYFEISSDGAYYCLGRADDMFISGGNNIHPREIELALESHKYVISSAVIGMPDKIKDYKPYAFVTVNHDCSVDELKNHALLSLPRSHCPREIWIVDNLPINSINKIDKLALTSQAALLLNVNITK